LIKPIIYSWETKFDEHKHLFSAYAEESYLEKLLYICKMKPYHYCYKKKSSSLQLYKHWFDEFGNSLIINDKKKIQIIYSDLRLREKLIIGSDLYYGLSIDKIYKIRKQLLILKGKDEDLEQDLYILSFLGIDNYLRTFIYFYGEWRQASSLILGIKYLKKIIEYKNSFPVKLKIMNGIQLPCNLQEGWLLSTPWKTEFERLLKQEHNIIFEILKE
jgi:hypothetical protein